MVRGRHVGAHAVPARSYARPGPHVNSQHCVEGITPMGNDVRRRCGSLAQPRRAVDNSSLCSALAAVRCAGSRCRVACGFARLRTCPPDDPVNASIPDFTSPELALVDALLARRFGHPVAVEPADAELQLDAGSPYR